jgi:hypothetical protein
MTCGLQLLEEVEAQLRAASSSVQTLFDNAVDRDMISSPSDGTHTVSNAIGTALLSTATFSCLQRASLLTSQTTVAPPKSHRILQ